MDKSSSFELQNKDNHFLGYYFQGSDSSFHDSIPFDDSSAGLLFWMSDKRHSSEQ
jgi:hypothetical protein